MSCGVNQSSLLKWSLLLNCLKMNRLTLFSSKSFPLISAGPQKPQKLNAYFMTPKNFNFQKTFYSKNYSYFNDFVSLIFTQF